jgi:hypothetical protein
LPSYFSFLNRYVGSDINLKFLITYCFLLVPAGRITHYFIRSCNIAGRFAISKFTNFFCYASKYIFTSRYIIYNNYKSRFAKNDFQFGTEKLLYLIH